MRERTVRIASLLIEQHADVNLGQFGRTPLSLAAETGKPETGRSSSYSSDMVPARIQCEP